MHSSARYTDRAILAAISVLAGRDPPHRGLGRRTAPVSRSGRTPSAIWPCNEIRLVGIQASRVERQGRGLRRNYVAATKNVLADPTRTRQEKDDWLNRRGPSVLGLLHSDAVTATVPARARTA
jgi:hypothetical protein